MISAQLSQLLRVRMLRAYVKLENHVFLYFPGRKRTGELGKSCSSQAEVTLDTGSKLDIPRPGTVRTC